MWDRPSLEVTEPYRTMSGHNCVQIQSRSLVESCCVQQKRCAFGVTPRIGVKAIERTLAPATSDSDIADTRKIASPATNDELVEIIVPVSIPTQ